MRLSKYAFFLLLVLLFSCSDQGMRVAAPEDGQQRGPVQLTEEQRLVAGITTGKMEKRLVAEVIDCTGHIDVPPTNRATVHAPISGQVKRIDVIQGNEVKTGDELALIADQGIAQAKEDFLEQRNKVQYWEVEFERRSKLYEDSAISKKEYLETKYQYTREQYVLQGLQEQLAFMGISEAEILDRGISSHLSIRSPLDGYVSDVMINIGSYVDKEGKMFEVINYEHVHLELSVYSDDINSISIGQRVRFSIAGSEEKGWGSIRIIGRKVNEINRSVLVHAHIDDYSQPVTIGSSIVAEILTHADSAFCLPESAIVSLGDSRFIYIVHDEGYLKRAVRTGRLYGGYAEILNFTELQDQDIVMTGAYYLAE